MNHMPKQFDRYFDRRDVQVAALLRKTNNLELVG